MCPIALTPGNNHPDESPTMSGLVRGCRRQTDCRLMIAASAGGNAISGPVRVTENPAIDPWMPLAGRCR